MSDRQWKPGDLAMGTFLEEKDLRLTRCGHGWARADDPDEFWNDEDDVRPLLVIDPESDGDAERLIEVMKRRGWSGLNDEAVSDMRNVLVELANPNPTPEPLPEPTDPAVRVVDANDDTWARVAGRWVSPGRGQRSWDSLADKCGPLRIVTPDAPTADADRPLKVGDRVLVSANAPCPWLRERVGAVVMTAHHPYSVRVGYAGIFAWLHPRFLTRVSEPTA